MGKLLDIHNSCDVLVVGPTWRPSILPGGPQATMLELVSNGFGPNKVHLSKAH